MKLYRFAKAESTGFIALKTIGSIVLVWSAALWILPLIVHTLTSRWFPDWMTFTPMKWLAVPMFLLGSAMGLSAAVTMVSRGRGTPFPFDAASNLVDTGMYSVVRNPMAVSAILQSFGVGLWFGSLPVLGYSLGAGALWHFGIRPSEERFLREQFGSVYTDYCEHTRLWLPRFNQLKFARRSVAANVDQPNS